MLFGKWGNVYMYVQYVCMEITEARRKGLETRHHRMCW